jgi:hypothetical protein
MRAHVVARAPGVVGQGVHVESTNLAIDARPVLAKELAAVANRPDVIVLALPRGGVPVGFEWLARSVRPLTCF